MLQSLIAIGLGATLGAWARWALALWLNPINQNLRYGTLAANLVGGYVIGLAIAWFSSHADLPPVWRVFVITGLLGGLTTFSTFSAEVLELLNRQQFGWGLAAIALHVVGSIAMTALGILTVRGLAAAYSG